MQNIGLELAVTGYNVCALNLTFINNSTSFGVIPHLAKTCWSQVPLEMSPIDDSCFQTLPLFEDRESDSSFPQSLTDCKSSPINTSFNTRKAVQSFSTS